MNEWTKEKVYWKEDFYKGMAAIVSMKDWNKLSAGDAVIIADRATFGACHHGDINNAFIELCHEKKRREFRSSTAETNEKV
ncbi:hypothetical protein [Litoreibacter albidus]|uniref:hypothetical protein n=1 Tax=Litoreibacter albidus TaxID=670155 RepID=UPI003735AD6B